MAIPFDTLVHTLHAALGADVVAATTELDRWQTIDGFHSALVDIVSAQMAIEIPIRQLALIRLRHGVEKYWKSRLQNNPLKEPEKEQIRSKILTAVAGVADDASVRLGAAAIGKMARLDLPNSWQDLFPALRGMLQSYPLQALPVIESVLEEFSAARTKLLRAAAQDRVLRLYQPLYECFYGHYAAWIARSSQDSVQSQTLLISTAALRGLTQTIKIGYDSPHQAQEIVSFWQDSGNILKQLITQLDGAGRTDVELKTIADHVDAICYFHVDLAWNHPVSFGAFPTTKDLVVEYWKTASAATRQLRGDGMQIESLKQRVLKTLNICALSIWRACIRIAFERVHTFKLLNPEEKGTAKQVSEFIRQDVTTEGIVGNVLMDLLSLYLVYDPTELGEWEEDPEVWEKTQVPVDDPEVQSIRQQAQSLLHDVVFHFKDQACPVIEASIGQLAGNTRIQERETMYSALGAVASTVHDRFDFNQFLQQVVAPDFERFGGNSTTLRHGIAGLLGKMFFAIDVEDQNTVHILYQKLLDPGSSINDLAVRLATAKSVRDTLSNYYFDAKAFVPYAGVTMKHVVRLIQDVEDHDHEIMLIELVGEIIDAMGVHAVHFEDDITDAFRGFWVEVFNDSLDDGKYLMRLRSLEVMAKFMKAFGGKNYETAKSALSVIQGTILSADWERVTDRVHAGLEVLLEIVRTVEFNQLGTDSFTRFFMPSLRALQQDIEWRNLGLDLIHALLMLHDNLCTQDYARQRLFRELNTALDDRSPEILEKVATIIEGVLSFCHREGGEEELSNAVADLASSGILRRIVDSIYTSYLAHNSTSTSPPKDATKHLIYYRLLARITLLDPNTFMTLLQWWLEQSGGRRDEVEHIFNRVLAEWFRFLEEEHGLTPLEHEKKMVMALTRLLELPDNQYTLAKLQELMEAWLRTVKELELVSGSSGGMGGMGGKIRVKNADSQVLDANDIANIHRGVYAGPAAPADPSFVASRHTAHTVHTNGNTPLPTAAGNPPAHIPVPTSLDPTDPAARPLTAHEKRVVDGAARDVVHRESLRGFARDRLGGCVLVPRGWGRGDVESRVELRVVGECWEVLEVEGR